MTLAYWYQLTTMCRFVYPPFFWLSFHSPCAGFPFIPCTISPSSFLVRTSLFPLLRSRAVRIIIMDETLLLILTLIVVFFMACTLYSNSSSQAFTTTRNFTGSYFSNIHMSSSPSSPSLTSLKLFAVAIALVLTIASVLIALVPLFHPSL